MLAQLRVTEFYWVVVIGGGTPYGRLSIAPIKSQKARNVQFELRFPLPPKKKGKKSTGAIIGVHGRRFYSLSFPCRALLLWFRLRQTRWFSKAKKNSLTEFAGTETLNCLISPSCPILLPSPRRAKMMRPNFTGISITHLLKNTRKWMKYRASYILVLPRFAPWFSKPIRVVINRILSSFHRFLGLL